MRFLAVAVFLTEVFNFINVSKADFLMNLAEVICMMKKDFREVNGLTVVLNSVVKDRMSESVESWSLCRG